MQPSTISATEAVVSSDVVERIEIHLQSCLRGRVFALRLQASGNGIILHGQSRTYHAKQLAQHMILSTFQYPVVANEIVVS